MDAGDQPTRHNSAAINTGSIEWRARWLYGAGVEQTAEVFLADVVAGNLSDLTAGFNQVVAETLVVALRMVMLSELFESASQRAFTKEDHPVEVRDGFRLVRVPQTRDTQEDARANSSEVQRQESQLITQQDKLLNLRLADDIDQNTFTSKHTELRDRLASIRLQLDVLDRSHDETAELASKVFELSQTLTEQWFTADYAAKLRILDLVFLNCRLEDATPCPQIRKPFDVLAEGLLVSLSRDDRRWTFPNDLTGIGLLHSAISQVHEFTADEFYSRATCCE